MTGKSFKRIKNTKLREVNARLDRASDILGHMETQRGEHKVGEGVPIKPFRRDLARWESIKSKTFQLTHPTSGMIRPARRLAGLYEKATATRTKPDPRMSFFVVF